MNTVTKIGIKSYIYRMNPAETYILNQKEPYKSILIHIQSVIEDAVPDVDLKYKYNIPFYYIAGKPYCYLNQSKDYVDVGFWHAARLTVYTEHMVTVGRKVMKSLRYKKLEDIDDIILIAVLQNAYDVRHRVFYK
ncbi:DUF1801 domain-containing protein [Leptobacterium sp. I13]|uniref:DUF1801 domain-containing protein n=1 Tax=Leptobacterium meishanense TaxID=3128904 RepID=UPI0030EF85DE